ncbi:MAG: S9 family peptidase [Bacillota bacterium]
MQTHIDRDKDEYVSRINIAATDGGVILPFTRGRRDRHPRWSPDGRRLAFLSDRGGKKHQVWVIPAGGGEARQLTEVKGGVREFCWSPDGSRIAFAAPVSERELTGCESETDDDVQIITRMRYKLNGEGFTYDRFSHLFVIDVEAGGEPIRITGGPFDHAGPAWDPGGQYVACSAVRCEEPDYADYTDIYLFPADGSGSERPIKVTDSRGQAASPCVNSSGERVLFSGHRNQCYGATLSSLLVTSILDGKTTDLLQDFPTTAGCAIGSDCRYGSSAAGPVFGPGDEEAFFLSTSAGDCNLYAVNTWTRQVRQLTDRRWAVTGFTCSAEAGRFALVAGDALNPGDIWVLDEEKGLRQLTFTNEWLNAEVLLSEPEEIEFAGAEGKTIQGWVMMPVSDSRQNDDGEYPMILEIHGGPHGAYGQGYYHEFHLLTALGYAVLYVNPHGSLGYGQQFNAATHCDWGGKDYRDLMCAVDHVLRELPLDPGRLGVTGGSFGGYMTNWIVSQTDRFRAAVTQRSTCNRYSMFGTSDIGFNHGRWEFPGYPWRNPAGYLERSPITYADNVTTPILIIHSENDLRCPISQAEEWFVALKRLKKEAVLVRFADENHELSRSGKPRRRLRRLQLITDWFDRHLP